MATTSCTTPASRDLAEKVSGGYRPSSGLLEISEPPNTLETLADRVDFLARLCSAWDFGVLPYPETVAEIRRPEWREAVDACRLLTSPGPITCCGPGTTWNLCPTWERG